MPELNRILRQLSAVLLICILTTSAWARHVQHDHVKLLAANKVRSARILGKAISKAATVASPESLFRDIANAAVAVHGEKDACGLIDQMAAHLKKWEKAPASWPKTQVNAFFEFAKCVAPFSRAKRDAYLVRGLNRSKYQSSENKHIAIMFAMEQDLYRAALLASRQPSQGVKQLQALLLKVKTIKYLGSTDSHLGRSYETGLLENLIRLDPELLIKVWPKQKQDLPAYCFSKAREFHRHTYGGVNRFSGVLLAYAIKNGKPSLKLLGLYKYYDVKVAYEHALKLPSGYSGGRGSTLAGILKYWAWSDPDKALELGEREKNADALRDIIQGVSTTWAYLRPEQVERALQKQDNKVRQGWARRIAAEELVRRKKGKPPTNSPDAFCPPGESYPRSTTQARFACSPEEKKLHIQKLLNIIKSSEDNTQYQLACLFAYDKALATKMLKPNKHYSSRREALTSMIHFMGYWGDHGIGEELLEEFADPIHYVSAACVLAQHAVERFYLQHGKGVPRPPRS
jgi:hypothetical protein